MTSVHKQALFNLLDVQQLQLKLKRYAGRHSFIQIYLEQKEKMWKPKHTMKKWQNREHQDIPPLAEAFYFSPKEQ